MVERPFRVLNTNSASMQTGIITVRSYQQMEQIISENLSFTMVKWFMKYNGLLVSAPILAVGV
jgi:hypothetical protein